MDENGGGPRAGSLGPTKAGVFLRLRSDFPKAEKYD
jgi:hypothetical protein